MMIITESREERLRQLVREVIDQWLAKQKPTKPHMVTWVWINFRTPYRILGMFPATKVTTKQVQLYGWRVPGIKPKLFILDDGALFVEGERVKLDSYEVTYPELVALLIGINGTFPS
jgi:hypothetical protein